MNRVKKVCPLCAGFYITQLYLLYAQSNSDKMGITSRTTQNTWQMQPTNGLAGIVRRRNNMEEKTIQ